MSRCRYIVGDRVWVRAHSLADRYPAVIELVLDDGYSVLWEETDQHVHVPAYAVIGLREVDDDE